MFQKLENERIQAEKKLKNIREEMAKMRIESSKKGSNPQSGNAGKSVQQNKKGEQSKEWRTKAQAEVSNKGKTQEKKKEATTAEDKPMPKEEYYAEVVGRRGRKKDAKVAFQSGGGKEVNKSPNTPPQRKAKKRKPPKTAMVIITYQDGVYEKVIGEARNKIKLAELGINGVRPRRAITGGYAFEVAVEDRASKADQLAAKLREAIGGEGVKITRPCKMAEIRLKGLDDSITAEVRESLVQKGQCTPEEIKVGMMMKTPNGQHDLG